MDFMEVTHL